MKLRRIFEENISPLSSHVPNSSLIGSQFLATLQQQKPEIISQWDLQLGQRFQDSQLLFCITDPHQQENPIIYVNDTFLSFTGYNHEEVIGRSFGVLCGIATDSTNMRQIESSIVAKNLTKVCVLNYKKDRSIFWNMIFIVNLRNDKGDVVHQIYLQLPVSQHIEMKNDEEFIENLESKIPEFR